MPDIAADPIDSSTSQPSLIADEPRPFEAARPANPLRQRLLFWARLIIGILLTAWLIQSGRFEPAAVLRVRSPIALIAAVLCQMVMIAGIALRWPLVLRARGLDMPFGPALRLGLAAQFASVWTPAGLGLDGARAIEGAIRFPTRKAEVFKAAALDRVCALVALVLISLPGGLWLLKTKATGSRTALGGPLALATLYFIALIAVAIALFAWKRARPWAAPFLLALIVHSANAGACVLCFAALGGNVTPEGLFFAAPLVVLSSLIPLTPLGIGVVDGAAAEIFFLAIMPGAAAATMLARATSVALSLGCGLLAMARQPKEPRA